MFASILLALCAGLGAAQAASTPLTLEQAIAAARAHSMLTQAASSRADAARTASRLAGRWPNPTIELRAENLAGAGWHWSPPRDPSVAPAVDAFALVNQPLELGGRRGARRAVALADATAATASLGQAERRVVLETVRLYLDALRARETLAALDAHLESFGSHERAMGARVREGVAAETDLAKFQAEAGRLQAFGARTRIEMNRSLAMLAALIADPGPIAPERLVQPADWPPPPAAAAMAAAVERSPEVIEARALETRAASALALERSRRLPDLSVTGGYKRTAGFDSGVLGFVVAVPLFDRNGAAIALAAGEVRAAASQRAAIERRAGAEAAAALEAARLLQDRARRADDEVLRPAETVRNAARAAFREGSANILNLVDAERVYLEARREVLQVKLDALAAAIEARVLLGEEIVR